MRDPTVLQRSARRIKDIMFSSLFSLNQVAPTIQAVLLLLLWPLPIETRFKDTSHALIGAAMQLATQNGFHSFGNQQDFARTRLQPIEDAKIFRARLWMYCIIVFQR